MVDKQDIRHYKAHSGVRVPGEASRLSTNYAPVIDSALLVVEATHCVILATNLRGSRAEQDQAGQTFERLELSIQELERSSACKPEVIANLQSNLEVLKNSFQKHKETFESDCKIFGSNEAAVFQTVYRSLFPTDTELHKSVAERGLSGTRMKAALANMATHLGQVIDGALRARSEKQAQLRSSGADLMDSCQEVIDSFLQKGSDYMKEARAFFYEMPCLTTEFMVEDCANSVGTALYGLRYRANAIDLAVKAGILLSSTVLKDEDHVLAGAMITSPQSSTEHADGSQRDLFEKFQSRAKGFSDTCERVLEDPHPKDLVAILSEDFAVFAKAADADMHSARLRGMADYSSQEAFVKFRKLIGKDPCIQAIAPRRTEAIPFDRVPFESRRALLEELVEVSSDTPGDALDQRIVDSGYIRQIHNSVEAFSDVLESEGAHLVTTRSEDGELLGFSIWLLKEIPEFWRPLHEKYQNGLRRGIVHYLAIKPEARNQGVYREQVQAAQVAASGLVDVVDGQVIVGPVPSARAFAAHIKHESLPFGDIRLVPRVVDVDGKQQEIQVALQDTMMMISPGMRLYAGLLLGRSGANISPSGLAEDQIERAKKLLAQEPLDKNHWFDSRNYVRQRGDDSRFSNYSEGVYGISIGQYAAELRPYGNEE